MTSIQICSKCSQAFPATKDFFRKDSGRKTGLYPYCKPCERVYGLHRTRTQEKHQVTEKECRKCRQVLPIDNFNKDVRQPDGHYYYCKSCKNEIRRTPDNLERNRIQAQNYRKKNRLEMLNRYSNNDPKCACCGEAHYEFLAIDHINGGGNQHRKDVQPALMYSHLKALNWPTGYQVLCHNCNNAKGYYGKCPHEDISEYPDKEPLETL